MIHLLREKPNAQQMQEMLQEYGSMVKIVVDIRRKILTGGGEMHSDCEADLLNDGSEQDDFGARTGTLKNSGLHLNP